MVCGAGSDHGKVEMASQNETCEHNSNKGSKDSRKKGNETMMQKKETRKIKIGWLGQIASLMV
jgi:hypothetical protein